MREVIGKYKMAKHFELASPSVRLPPQGRHRRKPPSIVRTSVPATELDAEHTVRAYKGLSVVERRQPQDGGPESAPDLSLRWRPRAAHVFLCMLAYANGTCANGSSRCCSTTRSPTWPRLPAVVAPAEVSPSTKPDANAPPRASRTRTLLDDLATVANNRVVAPLADAKPRPHQTDCAAAQSFQAARGSPGTYPDAFANFLFHSEKQQVDSRLSFRLADIRLPSPETSRSRAARRCRRHTARYADSPKTSTLPTTSGPSHPTWSPLDIPDGAAGRPQRLRPEQVPRT